MRTGRGGGERRETAGEAISNLKFEIEDGKAKGRRQKARGKRLEDLGLKG